jgi:hypothetical protein
VVSFFRTFLNREARRFLVNFAHPPSSDKGGNFPMVRRGSVWCGVAQYGAAGLSHGAAWLRMVRRGSVWCCVAQYGAAWLSMVWCGSVMVRRGSVGSASACWKAGPSPILGSAPLGGLSH